MPPSVVLDPSIFWLATGDEGNPLLEQLVIRSVSWLRRNALDKITILISGKMLERLAEAGVFPAQPHFENIIRAANLHHVVSPRELATYVARFMSNVPTIEESCPVRDALFEHPQFQLDVFVNLPREIACLSKLVCLLTAMNAKVGEQEIKSYVYGYSRLDVSRLDLNVQAALLMVDPDKYEIQLGGELTKELKLVQEPEAYYDCLDSIELWREAETAWEVELAIALAAKKIAAQAGAVVRRCRVGTAFLDALRNCQALGSGAHASIVLGKCALIAANAPNLEIHDFRERPAAGAAVKVRQRDQARARRLYVTGGHEGLRLMYWECPGGIIEFATVRNKFDLDIDEGNPLI